MDDEAPDVEQKIDWEALAKKDPAKMGAKLMEMIEQQTRNQNRVLKESHPEFGAQYDMSLENGDTLHIHFPAVSLEQVESITARIRTVFIGWHRWHGFPTGVDPYERPPHQPDKRE